MNVRNVKTLTLAPVVALILLFTSCSTFEDGPGLSLKTKTKRLEGDWKVVQVSATPYQDYIVKYSDQDRYPTWPLGHVLWSKIPTAIKEFVTFTGDLTISFDKNGNLSTAVKGSSSINSQVLTDLHITDAFSSSTTPYFYTDAGTQEFYRVDYVVNPGMTIGDVTTPDTLSSMVEVTNLAGEVTVYYVESKLNTTEIMSLGISDLLTLDVYNSQSIDHKVEGYWEWSDAKVCIHVSTEESGNSTLVVNRLTKDELWFVVEGEEYTSEKQ